MASIFSCLLSFATLPGKKLLLCCIFQLSPKLCSALVVFRKCKSYQQLSGFFKSSIDFMHRFLCGVSILVIWFLRSRSCSPFFQLWMRSIKMPENKTKTLSPGISPCKAAKMILALLWHQTLKNQFWRCCTFFEAKKKWNFLFKFLLENV